MSDIATTVPTTVEITCPVWCTTNPQAHADMLWDLGGTVDHRSVDVTIVDPVESLPYRDHVKCSDFTISLAAACAPKGGTHDAPLVLLDGHEVTLEQARHIAAEILRVDALWRAWSDEIGSRR